tara:strand:- start:88 stop:387 length:300 start_codon:yes stop_codon:yes gene_type:complete
MLEVQLWRFGQQHDQPHEPDKRRSRAPAEEQNTGRKLPMLQQLPMLRRCAAAAYRFRRRWPVRLRASWARQRSRVLFLCWCARRGVLGVVCSPAKDMES